MNAADQLQPEKQPAPGPAPARRVLTWIVLGSGEVYEVLACRHLIKRDHREARAPSVRRCRACQELLLAAGVDQVRDTLKKLLHVSGYLEASADPDPAKFVEAMEQAVATLKRKRWRRRA